MSQFERDRAIRKATRLSWRDKVVCLELSDIQGTRNTCWPMLSTVADTLGIDARNLRRSIATLESEGWIVRGRNGKEQRTFIVQVPDGQNNPVIGPKQPGERVETAQVKTTRSQGQNNPEGQNDPGQNDQGGEGQNGPQGRVKTTPHGTDQERIMRTDHGECVADATDAVPASPSLSSQISELESGLDADVCAAARDACALSRRNGKMADSVWLRTLRELSAYPPAVATEAMRTFAERYGDGEKSERYMVGIARSLAKGGRRSAQAGFGGMVREGTAWGQGPALPDNPEEIFA